MGGLGAPELLIVLVIILLVFGGSRLPKLGRSLGQAQRQFRAGTKEESEAENASSPSEALEEPHGQRSAGA